MISRGWKSARERKRDRENRVRARERKHRVGPSRNDVNTARRIRLVPSCNVKIWYRDARLRREISKRRQI
jgi:hypothetical protein